MDRVRIERLLSMIALTGLGGMLPPMQHRQGTSRPGSSRQHKPNTAAYRRAQNRKKMGNKSRKANRRKAA